MTSHRSTARDAVRARTSHAPGELARRASRRRVLPILPLVALGLVACGETGEDYSRQVLHSLDQGKVTGTKGTMTTLGRALSAYAVDHGGYPLGATLQDAIGVLVPTFLPTAVTVDTWNHPLSYDSDGRSYTLTSSGADGTIGSADDLVMIEGRFTKLPSPGP
jgi:hypothetical protein